MFDRVAHLRKLSADPAIVARRSASKRARERVTWTPEMDAVLVEMAIARRGAIPIAQRIGVSKAMARARRNQLGLPKGKPPGPSRKARQEPGTVVVRLVSA